MRKILIVAALLIIAGCANNRIDYNRQSMNLSLGMSKADVQATMGLPRRTDVNEDRERWIYWNPVVMGLTPVDNEQLAQDRLVVTFENGKVARWGNQTLTADMMEASQKTIEASYKVMQQSSPPKQ
ncbi:outer membrane protein assembly factor BamE domain-containing protein [Stutzerimonas stutzeri]|uniref:outer membrane protein assembly factor BamE domain-containing protein n=1 Tax=Stutzerimonas stutzeri TaxID=316 RepID=UPI000D226620|nr:outer membrane protein assembly factor BamE [Stutzerimonas stutzeri]AVX13794.1 outer membrane protein assembly factor BamE [Stutzerimonas stutzeri]